MPTRANIRSGYRNRLGLIALMVIAFGGYFVYDGAFAWPNQQRIFQTFEKIQKKHTDPVTGAVNEEWIEVWETTAKSNGWSISKPPDKWNRSDQDIFMQFVYALFCFLIGGYFAYGWIAAGRRWIATDQDGIATHTGEKAAWEQIKDIDKTRWKSKGIAVVEYTDNGTSKSITLDDWKYETEPTTSILAEVEARTGLGRDENGPAPDAEPPADDTSPDTAQQDESTPSNEADNAEPQ